MSSSNSTTEVSIERVEDVCDNCGAMKIRPDAPCPVCGYRDPPSGAAFRI